MAASDTCVSNLCDDEVPVRSQLRTSAVHEAVRSLSSMAASMVYFVVIAFCAYVIYGHSYGAIISLSRRAIASTIVGLVALLAYKSRHNPAVCNIPRIRETEAVLRSVALSQVALISVGLVLGIHARVWLYVVSVFVMSAAMITTRCAVSAALRRLHHRGYAVTNVAIYGHSKTAKDLASALLRSPVQGFHPVALLCDDSLKSAGFMFRERGGHCRSILVRNDQPRPAEVRELGCDVLIVAAPEISLDQLASTRAMARDVGVSVAIPFQIDEPEVLWDQMEIENLQLKVEMCKVTPWHSRLLKRAMDLTVTTLLLILGMPLFALIAACIRLDSPGPVFFRQKRVGLNGALFNIYKFRSMHAGAAAYQASPTESTDSRNTRVGRVLRLSGLDELPQLINVLRGEMSLVGPRPEMPFLVERHMREHLPRLQATPGITGLWQLSADRVLPIHENPQYDRFYIRSRTLSMDVAILLHTLCFAMRGGV